MNSEAAWLIHTRPYTDSRMLVDLLCENHGLVGGVFRTSKKTPRPQLFQKMEVQWQGKGELKNIRSMEPLAGTRVPLVGQTSWCGMYVNELLIKLLHREDLHPEIFLAYEAVLSDLQIDMEIALRRFELRLLNELGYGLDFSLDSSGQMIQPNMDYGFVFESGFFVVSGSIVSQATATFSGSSLKAISELNFDNSEARANAKKLTRLCIDQLLGGKVLKSRELFRSK